MPFPILPSDVTIFEWAGVSGNPNNPSGYGKDVAAVGDLNGDGYDDFAVGVDTYPAGGLDLRLGGPVPPLGAPEVTLLGLGTVVGGLGDVNGDGYDDAAVSDGIGVYVFPGGPVLSSVPSLVLSEQPGDGFGSGLSDVGVGDVNGDGYDDALVGAPDGGLLGGGNAYLYLGSAAGLDPSAAVILSGTPGVSLGACTGPAGDVNGDGFADALVGATTYASGDGAVFLYLGGPAGLAIAPSRVWTRPGNHGVGCPAKTVGDLDGDGRADLAWSAGDGQVAIVYGRAGLPGPAPDLVLTDVWAPGNERFAFGSDLAGGDFDGDGYSDLAVGEAAMASSAYVFLGGASGLTPTPYVRLLDDGWNTTYGAALSVGDLNADGLADLLVGASEPGIDSFVLAESGRVYWYPGLADADRDYVPDALDQCPGAPDQSDADGDGIPTGCDEPVLTVVGVVSPGAAITLRAEAAPGEQVTFWSANGPTGVGPCGFGTCLDLVAPVALGSATANAIGRADLPVTLSAGLVPGDLLSFQAGLLRDAQGIVSLPATHTIQ